MRKESSVVGTKRSSKMREMYWSSYYVYVVQVRFLADWQFNDVDCSVGEEQN